MSVVAGAVYAVVSLLMGLLTSLYGLVIFLSAFLLFLAEPMLAKRLLPMLGGSSAVWTTCLLFFQSGLLLGYLYAHRLVARLRPRTQGIVHLVLLAAAAGVLYARFEPSAPGATAHPILSILWLLTAMIGLPYLALAATTPLMQAWYARQPSIRSSAPLYRFYALSNLGSLLALLAYPTLVEPHVSLRMQSRLWSIGFLVFASLCAVLAWRVGRESSTLVRKKSAAEASESQTLRRRALWILLPACSSMLLCAFTNHFSQNIAAIPLLWILPLAAYLLSFIVAFQSPRAYPRALGLRLAALALATIGYILFNVRTTVPVQIVIPVFCIALFLIWLFCHGELYRLRPLTGDATNFYLLVSVGSTLGAFFVAVIAPNVFSAEYETVCGLVLMAALAFAVTWGSGWGARLFWASAALGLVYVGLIEAREWDSDSLVQLRSFYGVLRVTESHLPAEAGTTRILHHGTIQHGIQMFGDGLRNVPTSYYAEDSGVGLALNNCCANGPRRIGVVGLGAGTVAAYGRPGDVIRFYELDPLVTRLAQELFTFLRESQAHIEVVAGDARLSMERENPQGYDVLVLDAFSGDAVPVHLLTRQALALYRRQLRPGGVLAFHISSQYLDLEPLLAREAQDAGLRAVTVHSAARPTRGEFIADWLLMTDREDFLASPDMILRSHPAVTREGVAAWTDDFNSLIPILKPLQLSQMQLRH